MSIKLDFLLDATLDCSPTIMVSILLEDTLCDFFAAEDLRNNILPRERIFVAYNPISGACLDSSIEHNTKYVFQQWRSAVRDTDPVTNLVLMPQRMAWMLGRMRVIFFRKNGADDEQEDKNFENVQGDLERTIAVIASETRFNPVLCDSLSEAREIIGDSQIIPFLPADGFQSSRHYNGLDTHYDLLSKRALAFSGLPTPKAQVVDFCFSGTARSNPTVGEEVSRAIGIIRDQVPPFVLKCNSAGGGKAVYIVRTSEDHTNVEKEIGEHLQTDLPTLYEGNAYLNPYSLILTKLLPGTATNINFFVTYDGTARFSSACEQIISTSGHWEGGRIIYSAQNNLGKLFVTIMQKAATYLHSRGYHGPAGIDIMTDEGGEQNIVDLNPRPTGSFILGCLRKHFVETLEFDCACTLPVMEIHKSRAHFTQCFESQLNIGQIIVLAWYSSPGNTNSLACLAVGDKNIESLKKTCGAIEQLVCGE